MGWAHLDGLHRDGAPFGGCVLHVPLQVDIEELEDEVELLVGVDDV
jgi:hypothetical protein